VSAERRKGRSIKETRRGSGTRNDIRFRERDKRTWFCERVKKKIKEMWSCLLC